MSITVPIGNVMKHVRVDVVVKTTGLRFAKLRLVVSARLFRLAALVAGFGTVDFRSEP